MKRHITQLQSIAKRIAKSDQRNTSSSNSLTTGNEYFQRSVYECIDNHDHGIGGCNHISERNSNMETNNINQANDTGLAFEKSIFSEDEYQFLRDFYQDNENVQNDDDLLSAHSFTSIEKVVKDIKLEELMRKILRFAVKARLTESCLSQVLELFKESFISYGMISNSDLHYLTLKGFYSYFYMSQKTRLIRYCISCQEYDKNGSKSTCQCGHKWKDLPTYCYLRPLKFQMDERLFWNPLFRDQFQPSVDTITEESTISDRTHGSVYQQYHMKDYNNNHIDCVTGFFDSVSPFNNGNHSFYQASINFTEMKPHYRKKRCNNFLWFFVPKKPNHEEINLFLKILMEDLNHFNSVSKRKIRLERIVCDLPARSEILFFKQSGEYFCHLCLIQGESVLIETTKQTRYPIRVHALRDEIQLPPYRTVDYWKKHIKEGNFDKGMKSISPILDQKWCPNPSLICCYDSMHVLYEGILQDMMNMIPVQYWDRFDKLFLKQKYPSFLHKHPRKTTNGQVMNSLKAIEIYMISHYYLELFSYIEDFQSITTFVDIIYRFTQQIDQLTDSFNVSQLDSIEKDLFQVLKDYQDIVGAKKATPNFHICTELVTSCRMYGPLAMNSAFIGEGLNFTLSKTYVCSNSARYSIMYFDMCQLSDLLHLNDPLISGECIVGHYVISTKRDYLYHVSSKDIFQACSFSEDYKHITLKSIHTKKSIEITQKQAIDFLPCVVLDLPDNKRKYIPLHYNTYQYL